MLDNVYVYIAGSLSGIMEVIITHPLDRIKTEMQIMSLNSGNSIIPNNKKSSILFGINNIYKKNNISGFYSGIFPRLLGIIPMRLIYWSSMTTSTHYINDDNTKKNINNYLSNNMTNYIINIFPGITTGIAQSVIDNPVEVIKIKMMSSRSFETNIKNVHHLYQGFGYLLSRNIFFAIPCAYSIKTYGDTYPFLAGAFGGMIGSIISHPFDVIKTERQRHEYYMSNKKITLINIAINNPSKLFTGLTIRCSQSFINMGIGYVFFDYIHKQLCYI
jgi:solute carrier family 25 2-oxodicarboxylate transporter 21